MYLTENRLGENKYDMWKIISIICVTYVHKNFQIQTLSKQSLTKNINIARNCPIFQIFIKVIIVLIIIRIV